MCRHTLAFNLGMSLNTTPDTDILTPEESPLTSYCRNVQYEVIDEDEAGNIDDQHQDVFMNNKTRRFLSRDLTPEVFADISTVRRGLPPIGTAFFKKGEETPSESPQPQSFQNTEAIVPPRPKNFVALAWQPRDLKHREY